MSRIWEILRAATLADALVVLAVFVLVTAILSPRLSARAFQERVATAIADVDALGSAARGSRDLRGRWPASTPPGEAPAELSGLGGEGGIFSRTGYTLGWETLEVVDSVVAPPEPGPPPAAGDAPRVPESPRMQPVTRMVGAISVHSGEAPLLAELLAHYGSEVSFVVDTLWLLVLPERTAPSATGR